MLQHSTWYIGTAVVAKVAFRPGSFSGVDGFARKLRGVDNAYVIPHLPRRDHAVVAMRHVRPSPAQATPILACPRSRCWLLRFFFSRQHCHIITVPTDITNRPQLLF